jgi:hypothetical protein
MARHRKRREGSKNWGEALLWSYSTGSVKPLLLHSILQASRPCQEPSVCAPIHRYQVFERMIGKAGLPPVEYVWATLKQEEDRLCQDWPTGKYTLWTP